MQRLAPPIWQAHRGAGRCGLREISARVRQHNLRSPPDCRTAAGIAGATQWRRPTSPVLRSQIRPLCAVEPLPPRRRLVRLVCERHPVCELKGPRALVLCTPTYTVGHAHDAVYTTQCACWVAALTPQVCLPPHLGIRFGIRVRVASRKWWMGYKQGDATASLRERCIWYVLTCACLFTSPPNLRMLRISSQVLVTLEISSR